MKREALLRKLTQGNFQNVAFEDAVSLVEGFGFECSRIRGSHHVFLHEKIPVPVNLQEVRGEAKAYQLRQFVRLVELYNLELEAKES